MKSGWLLSLAALVAARGLAWAQTSAPPASPPPAYYDGPAPAMAASDGPYHPTSNSPINVRPISAPGPEPTVSGPPSDVGPANGNPVWTEGSPGGANDRFWARGEYLVWWMTDNRIPVVIGVLPAALAGTNPAGLPPGAITPLLSGDNLNFDGFSGLRITAGGWIDSEHVFGLEGSGFALARHTLNFGATSSGAPVVGPVFVDATNGVETIITPVDPSMAREFATASISEQLWGAEANLRSRLATFGNSPLEILVGFRYLDLDDKLAIFTSTDFFGAGVSSQTDSFHTHNRFYGGQVGASLDLNENRWSLTMQGKVALGSMDERVEIQGSTVDAFNGEAPRTFVGGVLTQPGNIGTFTHSQFAVVPELTLNLGYRVTRMLRVFVGYNLLYISDAVRPGGVIDVVNPAFIHDLIVSNPTSINRPLPRFESTDLWVQGVNIGLEFRY